MSETEKLVELMMKANIQVNCARCEKPIPLGRTFECVIAFDSTKSRAKFYHRDCLKR